MIWQYNDGGRKSAHYRGTTGDCVARAIAIATELPYQDIYDRINEHAKAERFQRGKLSFLAATGRGSSARRGVYKETIKAVLTALGWKFTPTMQIGSGCKVHLRAEELPEGRLIVSLSKHYVAVVDGVIHDLSDPSRNGTRCVYGYWSKL